MADPNEYDVGDEARLDVALDINGTPIDATTLKLFIRTPNGTHSDISTSLVHDGTGLYHAIFLITMSGRHHWRVEATGAVVAAEEHVFDVRKQLVPSS